MSSLFGNRREKNHLLAIGLTVFSSYTQRGNMETHLLLPSIRKMKEDEYLVIRGTLLGIHHTPITH